METLVIDQVTTYHSLHAQESCEWLAQGNGLQQSGSHAVKSGGETMRRTGMGLLFATLLTMVTLAIFSALPGQAQEGAIRGVGGMGSCTVFDGNGNIVPADRCQALVLPNGIITFQAHASGVPNATGQAVYWNYANTGVVPEILNGRTTTEWSETVSAAGEATLVAIFR
jgi:hypothetical protein